jgi:hypothetical protein
LSTSPTEATVLGPYLAFMLCAARALLPVGAAFVAFADLIKARLGERSDRRLRLTLLAALVVAILPWRTFQHAKLNLMLTDAVQEWESVARWARASTPEGSLFLIPTTGPAPAADLQDDDRQQAEAISMAAAVFESESRRRVWVDFKRGAAVMWQPSYYGEWRSRIDPVLQLRTLDERIAYARSHGITHVIDNCRAFEQLRIAPVYSTARLCVAAVS